MLMAINVLTENGKISEVVLKLDVCGVRCVCEF